MVPNNDDVTISVRYRPGNLVARPPVKVKINGLDQFTLYNEGVKRLSLSPGTHDMTVRCRFRKKRFTINIESPTKITIGFCRDCGDLKARTDTVTSAEDLDFVRAGY